MNARTSITVRLGEVPHEVEQGRTLADLVSALGHAPAAVSTAVNGLFVPREERLRVLQDGDTVLLFQPIVGG